MSSYAVKYIGIRIILYLCDSLYCNYDHLQANYLIIFGIVWFPSYNCIFFFSFLLLFPLVGYVGHSLIKKILSHSYELYKVYNTNNKININLDLINIMLRDAQENSIIKK